MSMPDPAPFKTHGAHGDPDLKMVEPKVGPYPKWVPVHESYIVRKEGEEGGDVHISVPLFPEFHVDRDGTVTVLVADEEEARRASSSSDKYSKTLSLPQAPRK